MAFRGRDKRTPGEQLADLLADYPDLTPRSRVVLGRGYHAIAGRDEAGQVPG